MTKNPSVNSGLHSQKSGCFQNNAPRAKISTFTTQGVNWSDKEWRKVRIERNIEEGTIKIFFDGKLIQEGRDKTFGQGYIGFGSFDDSGKVDDIKIWTKDAEEESRFF